MFILLIVIGALGYLFCDYNGAMEKVTGVKMIGSSVDADNLEGRPVKPYAIPRGHCKAYFPGDPHTPNMGQELFSDILYSGTSAMMADKQMNYYLSEVNVPTMAFGAVGIAGVDRSFMQSKFADLKTNSWQGGPAAPVGNNEATQASNFQSDAIKAQDAIDHLIENWAKEKKATIESRMATNIGGGRFNGIEIAGHLPDAKDRFRLRIFGNYPSKCIVVIGVVGNAKRIAKSSAINFLNSLEMWQ